MAKKKPPMMDNKKKGKKPDPAVDLAALFGGKKMGGKPSMNAMKKGAKKKKK
jgi:hypothetical protein